MPEVLLATLILLPVALTYLLKSNAALSFLALCGGFAVITLSGSDIEHLFGKTRITSLTSNDVDLILLATPLLLTLLFTYRAATSRNQRVLQVLPALCAGGLLAIVAAPMLNDAVQSNVTDSQFWKDLQNLRSYVVGAGLLISLLLIWTSGLTRSRLFGKKHK